MKTVQATLAAGLALHVATTAADKVPRRPWDNRTIAGCTWWWDNHDKWTCKQVRDEEYHISPEDFHRWNPSITLDCGNWQNHSYCIQVASEEVSTTSTSLATLVRSTTTTTSSLRPTPTGWKSLGCFIHDPRKPVFNQSVLEHGSDLTIEKCESACWIAGFDYAGLKGGSDCLCADYAGILSTKNKSDCDTPCPGNSSEACGGSTAVHAFMAQTPYPWERSTSTSSLSTTTSSPLTNTATTTSNATSTFTPAPVPGWRSLGCYKEFDPSLLGYMVEVPGGRDNLTRQNCCEACGQRAYSYAGVENGSECWCDNWTPGVWNVIGPEECVGAWVALKIEIADTLITSPEPLNLQSIHQDTRSDRVAHLIDSFVHEGPNGSHQCTVTELLGPSVDNVVADYHVGGERLESDVILKITKQLLEAICSLHEAGYAHGDLSGANVVFAASQLSHLSDDALFEIVGHPESAALVLIDGSPVGSGIPKQLIRSVSWAGWVDEDEEDIRLIDWGEAFKHGKEPARLAQPGDLKAPEIIFTGHFDHRIDLWRAGCIIYTLLFAARPFQFLGDDAVLIGQMIGFVEELPQQWRQKWEVIQKNASHSLSDTPFDNSDNLHQAYKLQSRFYALVDEPELMPLLPIIHGLMRFLPSERLTAAEALGLLG